MATQEEQNDKILAYLHDELDADEARSFEKELDSDQGLRDEFNAYKKLLSGLREKNYLDIADRVRSFEQSLPPLEPGREKTRPNAVIRRLIIGVAAAASIALVAVFTFQILAGNAADRRLAAEYYTPSEFISTRSAESSAFDRGFEAFNQGRLEESENLLRAISPDDEDYSGASYLLGHVYLRQHKYSAAAGQFTPFLNDPDLLQQVRLALEIDGLPRGINIDQVQWDLLIALTGSGEKRRAGSLLEQILQDREHRYFEAASELGKRIE